MLVALPPPLPSSGSKPKVTFPEEVELPDEVELSEVEFEDPESLKVVFVEVELDDKVEFELELLSVLFEAS